jgi:hypothetical protein
LLGITSSAAETDTGVVSSDTVRVIGSDKNRMGPPQAASPLPIPTTEKF